MEYTLRRSVNTPNEKTYVHRQSMTALQELRHHEL